MFFHFFFLENLWFDPVLNFDIMWIKIFHFPHLSPTYKLSLNYLDKQWTSVLVWRTKQVVLLCWGQKETALFSFILYHSLFTNINSTIIIWFLSVVKKLLLTWPELRMRHVDIQKRERGRDGDEERGEKLGKRRGTGGSGLWREKGEQNKLGIFMGECEIVILLA